MPRIYLRVLLLMALLLGPKAQAKELSQEIQTTIVRLYSQRHCDQVRTLVKDATYKNARPNVKAIIAYCRPENVNPEELFSDAEQESPTGDLILVLHAIYRSRFDPKHADPLWEKVLMIARNDYFRELAKDHLARISTKERDETPMDLSPSTGFIQLMLGADHETRPGPAELSFLPNHPSYGSIAEGSVAYRHWFPSGSIAVLYQTKFHEYFSSSSRNLWDNQLDVPLAIHAANAKDLIFRPVFGYSTLGSSSFSASYGIGMKGVVYRSSYVQSVQALIYANRIFYAPLTPEQGAHYRFEYAWDLYPQGWTISNQFSVEHVSASSVGSFLNHPGDFEMSHNDLELASRFERELPKMTIGFQPRIRYRIDTADSTYKDRLLGGNKITTRNDWDLLLRTDVTAPILPKVQLYAWYEWDRVFSNLGESDYANFNYENHTVGIGVKTSLSTY